MRLVAQVTIRFPAVYHHERYPVDAPPQNRVPNTTRAEPVMSGSSRRGYWAGSCSRSASWMSTISPRA
jgi:hypothetical protein